MKSEIDKLLPWTGAGAKPAESPSGSRSFLTSLRRAESR